MTKDDVIAAVAHIDHQADPLPDTVITPVYRDRGDEDLCVMLTRAYPSKESQDQ